jgi:hypothetical protein
MDSRSSGDCTDSLGGECYHVKIPSMYRIIIY